MHSAPIAIPLHPKLSDVESIQRRFAGQTLPSIGTATPNRPKRVIILMWHIQEYQQDLFHELQTEDELVILARGLGLLRLVTNLLHSYDAAGNNLVILVGAEEREINWIGEGESVEAPSSDHHVFLAVV